MTGPGRIEDARLAWAAMAVVEAARRGSISNGVQRADVRAWRRAGRRRGCGGHARDDGDGA